MVSKKRYVAWALTAALTLAPRLAHSNGRLPASNQIAVDSVHPNHVLLRTTFGILVSDDRGQNWDWVCENGLHYGGVQDPMLAFTSDGALVGATLDGFIRSQTASACDVATQGGNLAGKVFVDLTTRGQNPTTVLALTGGFAEIDDAGVSHYHSELLQSKDDAKTFVKVGSDLDSTVVFQTVDYAPSNAQRVYASGVRGVGSARAGVLLRSDDGGATFQEFPITLALPDEYAPYIAAVHPTDPNIVYVRTSGAPGAASRLLRTTDGGGTFSVVLEFKGPMLGFALSGDGSEVWAGGTVDRLHHALTSNHQFERISDAQVQCLTWHAGDLWVCSNEITGYIAGRSNDGGRTISPLLRFATIRGPLTCPSGSSASVCAGEWPGLKQTLGIPETISVIDGGGYVPPSSKATPATGELGGGACSSTPNVSSAAAVGVLAAVASMLSVRRRKRTP